jgi:hypothetical protein
MIRIALTAAAFDAATAMLQRAGCGLREQLGPQR